MSSEVVSQDETFEMVAAKGHALLRIGKRMYSTTFHVKEDQLIDAPDSEYIHGLCYRTRVNRLKFESGWQASIIFGTLTYCENRDRYGAEHECREGVEPHTTFVETPRTVEVMLFPPEGWPEVLDEHGWSKFDQPRGWQTVEDVQRAIDLINAGEDPWADPDE